MLEKEQTLAKLKELVDNFSSASMNKDYVNAQNEEWVKWNYIEPLLEILGWKRGDIEKEYRVLKGRADYLLKIGNEEVLVVEAKKVSVPLSEEEGRQAVSYAYHRKIKFAILTNFKEVRVYHALSNIRNIDRNLLKFESGGYFRFTFDQFLNNFDKLYFLSRESIEKKELNKLLSRKDEKEAKSIDESILDDLLEIREWLSKDLKKLRAHLTKEQIDEIVQILVDRLIFMRSVEDRGLEERDFLLKMVKDFQEGRTDKRLWESLKIKFKIFDKEYNSKLFSEGLLEKEGFFDEQTLSKVIKELYFGNEGQQERYMFDEIPGDLLGNIYEQYLGTILSGTEKRVKLDSASGKRKKMGIYYTPSYIVDYIVKNTVYEYIKDKSIDEILEINIVDPACGSGSFLIKAFECVCNVIEEKLKKGERGKALSFRDYSERLSLGQKATILTSCIYGVDLDEKAVELAQLNLLLKILEEETRETRKRILPNMKDNIKCGNSLIDDSRIAGDKAFKWEAQFPEAFHKGGFDIVIGNPPYGAELSELDKNHLKKKFYLDKTGNTASYFIFLGDDILKERGDLAFIVPKQLTYTSSWIGTRELLLKNDLRYVIDSSEAFEAVELEQIIFIQGKKKRDNNSIIVGFSNAGQIIENKSDIKYFSNLRFPLWITKENFSIFEKILSNSSKLRDIAKVNWGGLVAKYLSNERASDSIPCIRGREIKRYRFSNEYFIRKKNIDESYYVKGEKLIFQRIVCRYGEKIIANYRNARIVGTYVNDDNYDDKTVTLIWDSKLNLKFLLGFFNSKLINWFAHRYLWNRSQLTMEFMYDYAKSFPIRIPDKKIEQKITELVDKMLILQRKLHEGKMSGNELERIEGQVKNLDYEIDQEVYNLYEITKEEQKIIEESLK